MKCYVKPCEGRDTLFVSYCHSDAAQVFPIIERLAIEGYRVWYDNGVHPGEEWPETIARLSHPCGEWEIISEKPTFPSG